MKINNKLIITTKVLILLAISILFSNLILAEELGGFGCTPNYKVCDVNTPDADCIVEDQGSQPIPGTNNEYVTVEFTETKKICYQAVEKTENGMGGLTSVKICKIVNVDGLPPIFAFTWNYANSAPIDIQIVNDWPVTTITTGTYEFAITAPDDFNPHATISLRANDGNDYSYEFTDQDYDPNLRRYIVTLDIEKVTSTQVKATLKTGGVPRIINIYLPSNVVKLKISGYDVAGNLGNKFYYETKEFNVLEFTVDITPPIAPTITDVYTGARHWSSDKLYIKAGEDVVVNGGADATNTDKIKIYRSIDNVFDASDTLLDTFGDDSGEIITSTYSFTLANSYFNEGDNYIFVVAEDIIGNFVQAVKKPQIIKDINGPTFSAETPTGTIGPGTGITVSVVAADAENNLDLNSVKLNINGVYVTVTKNPCDASSCKITYAFTFPTGSGVTTYEAIAEASDKSINVGTKTWSFTVDPNVPGEPDWASLPPFGPGTDKNYISSLTPAITVTFPEPDTLITGIKLDKGTTSIIPRINLNEIGTYTYTIPEGSLTVGENYKLTVFAKKNLGAVYGNENSYFITLLADTTGPATTANSLKINNDALNTNSRDVTLTLSATDSESGVDKMMVSESSVFNGAIEETYATTKQFQLSAGDGEKTVYAKFRNPAGLWSNVVSKTIILDTVGPTIFNLVSSTHPVQENWYNTNVATLSWQVSGSDLVGYSYVFDKIPNNVPDDGLESSPVPPDTTLTKTISESNYGIWYFHIKPKDNAGNYGETVHYKLKIDKKKPETSNWVPAPGVTVGNTHQPISFTIDGTGSNIDCGSLVFKVNGVQKTPTGCTNTEIVYLTHNPLNSLIVGEQGEVSVSLQVNDEAGNSLQNPVSYIFYVDTRMPTFTLKNVVGQEATLVEGSYVGIEDGNQLTLKFTQGVNIQESTLTVLKGTIPISMYLFSSSPDGKTYTYVRSAGTFDEGGYFVSIQGVKDMIGNALPTYSVNFAIDTTPPQVTENSLVINEGTHTNHEEIHLTVSATEDSYDEVEEIVASKSQNFNPSTTICGGTSGNLIVKNGNSYSCTSVPYTLASGDGEKTVYVKFRNKVESPAKLWSDIISKTIILDKTPPGKPTITDVYTITRYWDGSKLYTKAGEDVTVKGTFDNNDTDELLLYVSTNNNILETGIDAKIQNPVINGNGFTFNAANSYFNEGDNYIFVVAEDPVNNLAQATKVPQIIKDTKKPILTPIHPPDGNEDGNIDPEIKAELKDDTSLATVVSGVNPNTINLKICPAPASNPTLCSAGIIPSYNIATGELTYQFNSGLIEGGNAVQYVTIVTAEDKAGNALTGSWSFTINPNIPEAPTYTGIIKDVHPAYFSDTLTPVIGIVFDVSQANVQINRITFVGGTINQEITGLSGSTYTYTPPILTENTEYTLTVYAQKQLVGGGWGAEEGYAIEITPDLTNPIISTLTLIGSSGASVSCTIGTRCDVLTSGEFHVQGTSNELYLKQALIGTQEMTVNLGAGTFSYDGTETGSGNHDYIITLRDKVNHETTTPIRVIVDIEEPTFILNDFVDYIRYVKATLTGITGTVTGAKGSTGVDIEIINTANGQTFTGQILINRVIKKVNITNYNFNPANLGDVLINTPIEITNNDAEAYDLSCPNSNHLTFSLAQGESETIKFMSTGPRGCSFEYLGLTHTLTLNSIAEPDIFTISGVNVAQGSNPLIAKVTRRDNGVESISNQYKLIYDDIPPTLGAKTPPTKVNAVPSIVSVVLEDNIGVDWSSVVVKIKENEGVDLTLIEGTDYTINTATGLIELTDPSALMTNPSQGQEKKYTITVEANDLAENNVVEPWNIAIDKKPPIITATITDGTVGPGGMQLMYKDEHELSVSANEPVECRYGIDVSDWNSMTLLLAGYDVNPIANIVLTGTSLGIHNLNIICEDEVANKAAQYQIQFEYTTLDVVIYDEKVDNNPLTKTGSTATGLTNNPRPTISLKTDAPSDCIIDAEYPGILGWLRDMLDPPRNMETSDNLLHYYPPSPADWTEEFAHEDDPEFTVDCEDEPDVGREKATETISFIVDLISPDAPTITTLPQTINTNTITITGTAEIDSLVYLVLDGVDHKEVNTTSDGVFSLVMIDKLAEGENTIQVKARDKAGNPSSNSNSIVVNYIATAPQFDYVNPADGTIVHSAPEIIVGFTLVGVPIDFTNLGTAGNTGIVVSKEGTNVPGVTSQVSDTEIKFTPNEQFTNGNYDVSIAVYDTLRNSDTYGKSFAVDNRSPQITITEPETNSYTNNGQINIIGTVTDTEHEITDITIRVYDSEENQIQSVSVSFTDMHYVDIDETITLTGDDKYKFVTFASNYLAASSHAIYVNLDTEGPEAEINITI